MIHVRAEVERNIRSVMGRKFRNMNLQLSHGINDHKIINELNDLNMSVKALNQEIINQGVKTKKLTLVMTALTLMSTVLTFSQLKQLFEVVGWIWNKLS